jgi:hypothetical protein
MKRINTHLTEQQIAELREIGRNTGLKVAELIRRAVDNFLENERRKAKK